MTEKGKRIIALLQQGKKDIREIMDICEVSKTTALKYRSQYLAEHPEKEKQDRRWKPKASEKEQHLRAEAISAKEIEEIRKKTRVGDIIPLQSLKMAEMLSGTEPTNGRMTEGVVISTKNRRFCIVQLSNGVTESILWIDLVKAKRER